MSIPTVDGVAHGLSTYALRDGSRIELTWFKGRKHGPYRHLASTGHVLEEGDYELGQRAGEWIQRDALGNTTRVRHYLLGVLHGVQERFELEEGQQKLVASTHYILGLRHGPAFYRNDRGHMVKGEFNAGSRHGLFVTEGKTEEARHYICGARREDLNIDLQQGTVVCPKRNQITLHVPKTLDRSHARGVPRDLQLTLCEASDVVGIPLTIDAVRLACPKVRYPASSSFHLRLTPSEELREATTAP